MKTRNAVVIASLLVIALSGCSHQTGTPFGEPMKPGARVVPVADVLASPEKYDGQTTRVAGIVTEVCEAKGCWLRLAPSADAEDAIFVKFTCPIEGRLIPLEAKGRPATVEGQIAVTELTVDEARHYAEDAGATPEEIAAITSPQMQVRAQSPGALVELN